MFRYSAINTAYTCLRKFDLQYNQGLQPDIKSGDMAFGTGIHLALSTYFEGGDPQAQFSQYWNMVNSDYRFGRYDQDQLKAMGEVFIARWLRLHSSKYVPHAVEKTLITSLNGFKVTGTPDFVGKYEGVQSVIDFKTSSTEYDKRKALINEQMPLYAYMAEKELDYKIEQLVYVVFIKSQERIQVIKQPLTERIKKEALDNITLMMRDLSSRTEFPKNKNSCLYCDFYKTCYSDFNGENK